MKKVSPPPSGTTLTRANSKKILQAVDPGFIQLPEAERQAHQPSQGTREMAVPGRSLKQGLNSHKDRAQLQGKSPPKRSGNIQILSELS